MATSNDGSILFKNVNLATMDGSFSDIGIVRNQDVAIRHGKIEALNTNLTSEAFETVVAGNGRWLLPGFIDAHTHLVFGGHRADEFRKRLNGESYQSIAEQGGGIKKSVKLTRAASLTSLIEQAERRLKRLLSEGVTTVEIKSGYGADLDTEIKMLKVAKALAEKWAVNISPTFLGAHTLPPDSAINADEYISQVCDIMLPTIASDNLANSIDVFCESIAFTPKQCERVFQSAQRHGLAIKAHVEQLSDMGGAVMAAKYGALSVDHIEYLNPNDVPQIKQADCVATLLPGAYYYLNETQRPPIDALRQHKVPMAVATDYNPGTSPLASLLTAANMACVFFGLTTDEALLGISRYAAKALGLINKGQIKVGADADLVLWDIDEPACLVYEINGFRPDMTLIGGKCV